MLWDKICSNETNIEKYHKLCHEQGTNLVVCHKCDQRFTNLAIRRHNNVCHGKQEFECPECGIVLNTADAVQSLQQGAQAEACAVKRDVLPLEKGNVYK